MDQITRPVPDDYSNRFKWSICRILNTAGFVVGGGWAVDRSTVITCAHVVGDALLNDKHAGRDAVMTGGHVSVQRAYDAAWDALRISDAADQTGPHDFEVVQYIPRAVGGPHADLAVLRRARPAIEPRGSELPSVLEPETRELGWVLGFPQSVQGDAVAKMAEAKVVVGPAGPNGHRLLSKALTGDQSAIRPGFSGAPLWSATRGACIGLIMEADPDLGTATLIPMSTLRQVLNDDQPDAAPLVESARPTFVAAHDIARVTPLRYFLDATVPRLHEKLTRAGLFNTPAERETLRAQIAHRLAQLERELAKKTFIPPPAREVGAAAPNATFQPIRQAIRQIAGVSGGGDAANATISALSKKSKTVGNLVKLLTGSTEPIILLGEPGAGKSITLAQAEYEIARRNLHRIYPTTTIFVPLGRWQAVAGRAPTAADVGTLVRRFCPDEITPYLDALAGAGRLVIIFDGMDEMSRRNYVAHTQAMHEYAKSQELRQIRTLFSCRIADFSPNFEHRRLVLLPFRPHQIREFLRRQFGKRTVTIDGHDVPVHRLVNMFEHEDTAIQIANPYVLYLLSLFIRNRQTLPRGRIELMRHYYEEGLKRHAADVKDPQEAFDAWGTVGSFISDRNQGGEVVEPDLVQELGPEIIRPLEIGVRVGLLVRSLDENPDAPTRLRFENHRAQEYFTALHLAHQNTSEDWRDRLDAPRWQETLVNLAQMGAADGVLSELDRAMTAASEKFRRAKGMAAQARLAEFVDLGSRVLENMPLSPARDTLAQAVARHTCNMLELGNPSTQAAALGVVQRTPELVSFSDLRPAFDADTRWVRAQAHTVAPMVSRSRSRDALTSDIAYSAGEGSLLRRLPSFLSVIWKTRAPRAGIFLIICVVMLACQLVITLGAPLILHFLGNSILQQDLASANTVLDAAREMALRDDTPMDWAVVAFRAHELDDWRKAVQVAQVARWISAGFCALSLIYLVMHNLQLQWAALLANVGLTVGLALVVYLLWARGGDTGFGLLILAAIAIFSSAYVLMSFLAAASILLAYAVSLPFLTLGVIATARLRTAFKYVRALWSAALFEEFWPFIIPATMMLGFSVLYAVVGGFFSDWVIRKAVEVAFYWVAASLYAALLWLLDLRPVQTGVLWPSTEALLALALGVFIIGLAIKTLIRLFVERMPVRESLRDGTDYMLRMTKPLFVLAGLMLFLQGAQWLLIKLSWLTSWLSSLILLALLLALFAVLCTFVYMTMKPIMMAVRDRINFRGAGYLDADDWVREFRGANPLEQAVMMNAFPQRFDLEVAAMIAVLERAEMSVKEDPARSAFYAKVTALQAMQKQEHTR